MKTSSVYVLMLAVLTGPAHLGMSDLKNGLIVVPKIFVVICLLGLLMGT
jgi:hypothetical protein